MITLYKYQMIKTFKNKADNSDDSNTNSKSATEIIAMMFMINN